MNPKSPSTAYIKVLVVEDESTIAGNLLQYLEMQGCQADVAYDGPTAARRST